MDNVNVSAGDSSGANTGGISPTAQADAEGSSSSATLEQDSATESTPQSEPGPIPFARFKQVNDRYQSLKWAEAHDPNRVSQQKAFFDWLDTDPEGAFRYLEDYLSRAGAIHRAAGNGQGQRIGPDVVIPETGQRFYSADAHERSLQRAVKEAEERINQRLSPIEQSLTVNRARSEAQRLLSVAETWPFYKDHESDILHAMQADQRLSLEGAYNRVVVPRIRQLERQTILAEMKQKPDASTVNPGAVSATDKRNVSKLSFSDIFRREMAKRGGRV